MRGENEKAMFWMTKSDRFQLTLSTFLTLFSLRQNEALRPQSYVLDESFCLAMRPQSILNLHFWFAGVFYEWKEKA
jgi:hypothetical protein